MKVKIFQSVNGYLNVNIGGKVIVLETAINDFLKQNKIKKVIQIVQSQSCSEIGSVYMTTSIFY